MRQKIDRMKVVIDERIADVGKNGLNFLNLYPMDNYVRFVKWNADIKSKCFNIHPNLVLPDVTHSMLRSGRDQLHFVRMQTVDRSIKQFKKYWRVRFFDKHFEKLTNHSPSNLYLRKNESYIHSQNNE